MKFVIALALLYPGVSMAEQAVGNGGHGVKCTVGSNITYETLDIYELKAAGKTVQLGPPGTTVDQKVDIALQRFRAIDPNRYAAYAREAADFSRHAVNEVAAPQTGDQGVITLQSGCEVVQIIAQYSPRFPGDIVYVIGTDNWDLLDDDSKATLIVHEVLYRQAIQFGLRGSTEIRKFVGLLISGELANFNREQYFQAVRAAKLIGYGQLDLSNSAGIENATADGTAIFYGSYDTLFRIDLATNRETQLVTSNRTARLALSSDDVYFSDDYGSSGTQIWRVPKDASSPPVQTGIINFMFRIYNNTLFVVGGTSANQELWRYDLPGLTGQKLADLGPQKIKDFQVNSTGFVFVGADSSPDSVQAFYAQPDGSGFATLGSFEPLTLANDDTDFYFVGKPNTPSPVIYSLYHFAIPDGTPELLMESDVELMVAAQEGRIYIFGDNVTVREKDSTVDRYLGDRTYCRNITLVGENIFCYTYSSFGVFYKSIF